MATNTEVGQYKWDSAFDWLFEKIEEWKAEGMVNELAFAIREIIRESDVDADAIQTIYQGDMERDGYFVRIGDRRCRNCGEVKGPDAFESEDDDECRACVQREEQHVEG
jgi:hypothetical protein